MNHTPAFDLLSQTLSLAPWVVLGFISISLLLRLVDHASVARQARRDQQLRSELLDSQIAEEIVLRGDFDDWLTGEVLRFDIACANQPRDEGLARHLAVLAEAKRLNSADIVTLHRRDSLTPDRRQAVEQLKKQWDALRTLGASA